MGTTWGTAEQAAPTVSTAWLSAMLRTPQNCSLPPQLFSGPPQLHSGPPSIAQNTQALPVLSQSPLSTAYSHPASLRATKHCSGHPLPSPPSTSQDPSALPISPQHSSEPPPQHCPLPPSSAQDPPALCLLPFHPSGAALCPEQACSHHVPVWG